MTIPVVVAMMTHSNLITCNRLEQDINSNMNFVSSGKSYRRCMMTRMLLTVSTILWCLILIRDNQEEVLVCYPLFFVKELFSDRCLDCTEDSR